MAVRCGGELHGGSRLGGSRYWPRDRPERWVREMDLDIGSRDGSQDRPRDIGLETNYEAVSCKR